MAFPIFAPRPARLRDSTPDDAAPSRPPANVRVEGRARAREVAALLMWTAAVFLALALASYVGSPSTEPHELPVPQGANWVGPVGEACARALVTLVGVIAWALPLEIALLGIPLLRDKPNAATPARLAGDVLIVIIAAALVQVGWPMLHAFGQHGASGMVGELFGELARSLFSTVGSFLVGFASLGLILIARAAFSFIALMGVIGRWSAKGAIGTASGAKTVAEAWSTARSVERERAQAQRLASLPNISLEPADDATIAILPDDPADFDPEPVDALEADPADPRASKPKRARRKKEGDSASPAEPAAPLAEPLAFLEIAPLLDSGAPMDPAVEPGEPVKRGAAAAEPVKSRRARKDPKEPVIVDTSAALAKEPVSLKPDREKGDKSPFRLPPIELLVAAKVDPTLVIDKEVLFKNAELLVKTLADYGVSGKVEDILPGPTVTTFEVSPQAGTKVSKVASLADDLALALAKKVRIVAPIPGKNRIGFELPNERRVPVSLRDLIEDRRFQMFDAPLPVVLGRDILGNPVYADLASMPHVIVAGATGAGKSVGLNVMLTSLLYRKKPEDLRLLMIDPKVVELAPFDGIAHMLLPVVTDMKQASTALKWAVDEMERRYQLFADAGTKNIGTYNNWVARVIRGEIRNPAAKVVIAKDHNGLPEAINPDPTDTSAAAPLPEKLPLIVIVVDEFADLMMQQGKEVETAVARLAQKARAAGMHVILATQRPSVDVITGMIKANFPTRIAYRVAQKVDSRTILDEQGAEHLLGRGDMLIKLNGTNETKRVQCPMVSEEEVQGVTDFLRAQGSPVYDENILKPRDDEEDAEADDDAEQDTMYDEAVRLVADTRRCSTSWLQRKLALGYNRAARIVETMERRGIVGPANGAKDREVLIQS
jgi:S-DNA-T family DNA segregation ATPase FtsK/SpoIIIE